MGLWKVSVWPPPSARKRFSVWFGRGPRKSKLGPGNKTQVALREDAKLKDGNFGNLNVSDQSRFVAGGTIGGDFAGSCETISACNPLLGPLLMVCTIRRGGRAPSPGGRRNVVNVFEVGGTDRGLVWRRSLGELQCRNW